MLLNCGVWVSFEILVSPGLLEPVLTLVIHNVQQFPTISIDLLFDD